METRSHLPVGHPPRGGEADDSLRADDARSGVRDFGSWIPRGAPSTLQSRRTWLTALIIALVALSLYSTTLEYGFVWDDHSLVLSHRSLGDWSRVVDLLTADVFRESQERASFDYWRPMVVLSYMVDHTLFGRQPWGFHLVNVLLHAMVSVLVFLFAGACLGRCDAAAVAGLLFAVHPVHVEVVAWVSGRSDLLVAACLVTALLADWVFVDTGRRRWQLFSLTAFAAALLAKEAAVVFPALVAVRRFLGASAEQRVGWRVRQALVAMAPSVVVLAAYLAVRHGVIAVAPFPDVGDSPARSVLFWTWWSAFWLYVRLLVWPSHLSVLHELPLIAGPDSLSAVAGVVLFAVALWAAWKLRNRAAGAAYALLILILGLLLLSNFVVRISSHAEAGFPVAERFLYFPSVGFCLLAAWLVMTQLPRVDERARHRAQSPATGPQAQEIDRATKRPIGLLMAALLSLSLVVVGSVKSCQRSRVWRDEVSLFGAAVRESPGSATAQLNYGVALADLAMREDDPVRRASLQGKARDRYLLALRLAPGSYRAHFNLGNFYRSQGAREQAEAAYREALRLNPHLHQACLNLGIVLAQQGRLNEALGLFQRAEQLLPGYVEAKVNRGHVLRMLKRPGEAIPVYEEALALEPERLAVREALALAEAELRSLQKGGL